MTSFARRALRARSAFFWSFDADALGPQAAVLISRAGETDGFDAEEVATSFARHVLAASGPIADRDPCALSGVAVRAQGEMQGVLCVADPAPRAFDAEDLALIDEVGASLARELVDGAAVCDRDAQPLDAIISLSNALVREASVERGRTQHEYLAAADHLSAVATQLRELAGTEPPDADAAEPVSEAAGTPQRGVRILLADDLDLNRKLVSDMLTLEGYAVDCVADGAAAVKAVEAKAYDIVLMDVIMPGMDGIAATLAIRALPAPTCRVPIVALTANSFREQIESCLQAGMDAALTKPMTFDALIQAVANWTRDRSAVA